MSIVKADNVKHSAEQNHRGSVVSYHTRPGNGIGLIFNAHELCSLTFIAQWVTRTGVDPAGVRASGPSWNFASEGTPLFGPSQNVWSTVKKHSEHNLCQYQWIL